MGGLKFEKPVVIAEPLKAPLEVLEVPKLTLPVGTSVEGEGIIPEHVQDENVMKITPELGQSSAVRYSTDLAMVRFNPGDVPTFLQKYEMSLTASQKNLEGLTESLHVYVDHGKVVSGAKKGALSFLGAELLVKLIYGGFLTGDFALGMLSYFVIFGAYLGWAFSKGKTPPPLPEARLLESGRKPPVPGTH